MVFHNLSPAQLGSIPLRTAYNEIEKRIKIKSKIVHMPWAVPLFIIFILIFYYYCFCCSDLNGDDAIHDHAADPHVCIHRICSPVLRTNATTRSITIMWTGELNNSLFVCRSLLSFFRFGFYSSLLNARRILFLADLKKSEIKI